MVTTVQNETSNVSPQPPSDHSPACPPPSNIIPLSKEQAEFTHFSVGCPVFYNIRFRGDRRQSIKTVDVTEGIVQSASLEMVSRKFWYSIKRRRKQGSIPSNMESEEIDTVIEDEILYACKCPILLDGTIEGEIVHFKPPLQQGSESEKFHYTVLYFTEDGRLRIEEDISAGINGRIKYRAMNEGQHSILQETESGNRSNRDNGSSPLELVSIPLNDDSSQNEVSEISERSDASAMSADVVDNRNASEEEQPIVKHKSSNNVAEDPRSNEKTNDRLLSTCCEASRNASMPIGNMPTACRKEYERNNTSSITRSKSIDSPNNATKINTACNNTNERSEAFDSSDTLRDPISSMLTESASRSSAEPGSSPAPQSRQLSPSSMHFASQRNGERPNSSITTVTSSESKLTRTTQNVEHPVELGLDTVEEEEVIYISSSDSLFSGDHKSQNETDVNTHETSTRKESNPANVSTDSREKFQEHVRQKNIPIPQNIPRKRPSVGYASSLSSLPNMRDKAPTTTHDRLREPLIHPRSMEHKYPAESRKRQLVNNSRNCCNTPPKVPKRDKIPPLTLTLTIPHWLNHKELCSYFLENGGYRTRLIRSSSGCNLHLRERGLPMTITLKSSLKTNLIDAKEMVEECICEFTNDRLSEGRLRFELSSTLSGTFEPIRSRSGAVTKRISDTSHGWIQLVEFLSVRKDGIRNVGNQTSLDQNIMQIIDKETNCSARLFIDQFNTSHHMLCEPYVLISGRRLDDVNKAASIITDSRHYLRND